MNCEFCGRKLRTDEGKVCRFCTGKITRALEKAEADAYYQAGQESEGHLSGNPNDRQTL